MSFSKQDVLDIEKDILMLLEIGVSILRNNSYFISQKKKDRKFFRKQLVELSKQKELVEKLEKELFVL